MLTYESLSTPHQAFAAYQPFFVRPSYIKQRALKKEILANKAELNATSSQDQFAKWAKLRRKLDKGLVDLEKLSESAVCAIPFFSLLWLDTDLACMVIHPLFRRIAFIPSISIHKHLFDPSLRLDVWSAVGAVLVLPSTTRLLDAIWLDPRTSGLAVEFRRWTQRLACFTV
jgi:hypothetical protein